MGEQEKKSEVLHDSEASSDYMNFDPHDFPGGLIGCLEAILISAEGPLEVTDFARLLWRTPAQITRALEKLRDDYSEQKRGFELMHSARGWRFVSRADYDSIVSAAISEGQSNHLSQAALEALAIIAYKQPITRTQVSSIRGVNSDGVIRSLMLRGFVAELGEEAETRARLLATTDIFLEKIGVSSLEELPALAPFLPSQEDIDVVEDEARNDENGEALNSADDLTAFNQYADLDLL